MAACRFSASVVVMDDQHRHGARVEDVAADAAKKERRHLATAARAHDDEVVPPETCFPHDRGPRRSPREDALDGLVIRDRLDRTVEDVLECTFRVEATDGSPVTAIDDPVHRVGRDGDHRQAGVRGSGQIDGFFKGALRVRRTIERNKNATKH